MGSTKGGVACKKWVSATTLCRNAVKNQHYLDIVIDRRSVPPVCSHNTLYTGHILAGENLLVCSLLLLHSLLLPVLDL